MWWRLPRARFEVGKGQANREALQEIVAGAEIPGVLAFASERPVGWCAVGPRAGFPGLARSRVLAPVDDAEVWSIVCLYVARPHRRRGVSVALIEAAAEFALGRGGQIVEGYPVEPSGGNMPDAFAWTGTAAAFRAAGFVEVARRSPTRPIVRYRAGGQQPNVG
jgi:GNAT superfamily N-acetyltransferase